MIEKLKHDNPLATEKVSSLIFKFAIPSIIAMLVTSLYNLVDQIFIGRYVGELGNGATNIAFPLSTFCTAISLLFGIGGASAFNLSMGAKDELKAKKAAASSIFCALIAGLLLSFFSLLFLKDILLFCGSTKLIFPYAKDYTSIVVLGFPFVIFSISAGHLIRGDGKAKVAMICNLSGAIINTFLDALFIIVFGWGMKGAALATVIGQVIASLIALYHIINFESVKFAFKDFMPELKTVKRIFSLGMSHGFNQIAMMIVQIVCNNSLKYYGSLSVYGEEIPIAVVGVASKLAMLYFSICIGLTHAMQPVVSFNYGARDYVRAKKAFSCTRNAGTVVSFITFLIFQFFPKEIISVFGKGSPLYVEFAVRYIKLFLFCTFINNIQPLTSSFFSAIGKAKIGLFLSLSRQILFFLPLIIILPKFLGINGLLYAGIASDFIAFVLAVLLGFYEFTKKEWNQKFAD